VIQILVLAFLLFIPGLAVNLWLTPRKTGLFTLLIESAGISLALMALLAQVGFWLGIRFSAAAIWIILVLCALSVMAAVRFHKPEVSLRKRDWIGLGLLTAVTVWRFFQIDGLVLPAWVDSVHHTLIVQTILTTGGLPQDLTPVLQVPFFYHYVFHVFSTLLADLGHLHPYQAVLWAGQVVNSLAVVGVYRLSIAIWDDEKKAGLAVLLAGFVLEMPAFYLAWGRYTLLTGLVFLPLALATSVDIIKHPSRPDWVKLAFFTAGSFLSHYLAGLLLLLGIGLLLVADYIGQPRSPQWKLAWNLILGCALGVLLALPWLWRAWGFPPPLCPDHHRLLLDGLMGSLVQPARSLAERVDNDYGIGRSDPGVAKTRQTLAGGLVLLLVVLQSAIRLTLGAVQTGPFFHFVVASGCNACFLCTGRGCFVDIGEEK